jgi:SAM-dependent methyltransferase
MNSLDQINPQLYQLHHSGEEDVSFWLELARKFKDPVLEIGCGTGRILIPLARAGYRVVGLDNNFGMLAYLWKQLESQIQERVNVFQADVGAFHLEKRYPFIFLACNTLSTMGKESRQRAYNRIYEHLAEEGIFAASIPNPKRLDDLQVYGEPALEEIYTHPKTGNPLQVSSEWERGEQTILFRWHYDHLFPDGQVERTTVENKHTIISSEDYLDELRSANLHPVAVYGNFDKSEYSGESPYLIFLTKRE